MTGKILLTGASGYIGGHVVQLAARRRIPLLALLRHKPAQKPDYPFLIPSDWRDPVLLSKAMEGCTAVIHVAGLAHGKSGDMEDANVRLTRTLAEAAVKAGVKRFVFVSSAAVFGHEGRHSVSDDPNPVTPYGRSKMDAEALLADIFHGTGIRLSIVRPPSVLGPGAPGRSDTIRKLAAKKWPLPLGSLPAERSFILVDDLAAQLLDEAQAETGSALIHPQAAVETSTGILKAIAAQDGFKLTLFPFPSIFLKLGALVLGTKGESLRPLFETHILEPGRVSLDRVV